MGEYRVRNSRTNGHNILTAAPDLRARRTARLRAMRDHRRIKCANGSHAVRSFECEMRPSLGRAARRCKLMGEILKMFNSNYCPFLVLFVELVS